MDVALHPDHVADAIHRVGLDAGTLHGHVQAQIGGRPKHKGGLAGGFSRQKVDPAALRRHGTVELPRNHGRTFIFAGGTPLVLQEATVHNGLGRTNNRHEGTFPKNLLTRHKRRQNSN